MECVNSLTLTDVWGFHSLSESENLGKWIATASAPNLERIVLLLLLRKTCKPWSSTLKMCAMPPISCQSLWPNIKTQFFCKYLREIASMYLGYPMKIPKITTVRMLPCTLILKTATSIVYIKKWSQIQVKLSMLSLASFTNILDLSQYSTSLHKWKEHLQRRLYHNKDHHLRPSLRVIVSESNTKRDHFSFLSLKNET